MNFSQFAFLNIVRNKRAYLGYFLSNVLAVMAFFTFMNLAFHPFLANAHAMAVGGMKVASYFILFFSFFYVGYSMNAFLQLRKKEFGILMIHGLSPKQLRRLIQQENFFIGIVATIVGILLGFIASFGISFLTKSTLQIELGFYFPTMALLLTVGLFTLLFFVASTYVFYKISSNNLLSFIKQDKARTAPKASILATILGVALIVFGYALSYFSPSNTIILILVPVAVSVTLGTYLILSQGLVFWATRKKHNKKKFWLGTNMLFFADMDYRLKENARSFFFISIITTVVFCAIGTLFSLEEMFMSAINFQYDYTYTASSETKEIPEEWVQIREQIQAADGTFQPQESFSLMVFTEDTRYTYVSETAYNMLSDKQLHLANNTVQPVYASAVLLNHNTLPDYTAFADLTINEPLKSDTFSGAMIYAVVNDATYELLENTTEHYYEYTAIGNTALTDGEQIDLTTVLLQDEANMNGYLNNGTYILHSINMFYAPVLFIGIFIGIVFFISAGSFLYFRLYGDLAEDKEKFKNIARIGITRKEIKKIVTKQLALLFGVPMIIALCHGVVALNTMAGLFNQTIMVSALVVMGVFALIQFIYFLVANHFYLRNVSPKNV